MASRGRSGGGVKGGLMSGIVFLMIAGFVVGWARTNNINSVEEFWDYAKSWSNKANSCVEGDESTGFNVEWTCSEDGIPTIPDREPGTELPKEEVTKLQVALNKLTVKDAQTVDYDRDDWKHWSDLDGNKCSTREDVLIAQGKSVKFASGDSCKVVSGKWVSPYEKAEFTDPSALDIDHVIPLSYAAKHGGNEWPAAKKEQFANDFTQLLATSAKENRGKGDKGPGAYMPPSVAYHCTYAQLWISTASKYGVTIDSSDKKALEKAIKTC